MRVARAVLLLLFIVLYSSAMSDSVIQVVNLARQPFPFTQQSRSFAALCLLPRLAFVSTCARSRRLITLSIKNRFALIGSISCEFQVP